jgi:predicted transcriptional regulator
VSTAISKDGTPLPPYEPGAPENLLPGGIALPDEVYRARVDVAVALRHTQKLTSAEIAKLFGVEPSTVKTWFRRARKEGRLRDEVNDILDKDLIFDALEVLQEKLGEGNLEAALALAKGRGHLRNYTNSNIQGGAPVTAIQIVYTTPDGSPPPQLTDVATLPGQIVGTPRSDPPAKVAP